MKTRATGTLPRVAKGPVAPAPRLDVQLQTVVDGVSGWPGIGTTVHWHLVDRTQIDGVDFYWHAEELGYLHLDGSIHLATNPELGGALIADGLAKPFRYQRGWIEEQVNRIGIEAAVKLFRRNYEDLVSSVEAR